MTSNSEFLPVTYIENNNNNKRTAGDQLSKFDSGMKSFQSKSYLSKRQSHALGDLFDLSLIGCEIKGFEWLLKRNKIHSYCVVVQIVSVMACDRTNGSWIKYKVPTYASNIWSKKFKMVHWHAHYPWIISVLSHWLSLYFVFISSIYVLEIIHPEVTGGCSLGNYCGWRVFF